LFSALATQLDMGVMSPGPRRQSLQAAAWSVNLTWESCPRGHALSLCRLLHGPGQGHHTLPTALTSPLTSVRGAAMGRIVRALVVLADSHPRGLNAEGVLYLVMKGDSDGVSHLCIDEGTWGQREDGDLPLV
jgi:hypothetical protein